MVSFYKGVSNLLRELREEVTVTINDAAELMGFTESQLREWETRETGATFENRKKRLEHALKTTSKMIPILRPSADQEMREMLLRTVLSRSRGSSISHAKNHAKAKRRRLHGFSGLLRG